MKFLEELVVNKKTIQQAIDISTEKGQGTYRDYYFGKDNGEPSTWPEEIQNLIKKRIQAGIIMTELEPGGLDTAPHRQLVVIPASAGQKTIHQLLNVNDPRD
jgi:hypothetical protein